MLNWAGRIVCSSASGAYAFSDIAMGSVIQAGQVLAEEPDRECPSAQEGLLRIFSTSLGQQTPNSEPGLHVWVWA